jgi:hypothetical protein
LKNSHHSDAILHLFGNQARGQRMRQIQGFSGFRLILGKRVAPKSVIANHRFNNYRTTQKK